MVRDELRVLSAILAVTEERSFARATKRLARIVNRSAAVNVRRSGCSRVVSAMAWMPSDGRMVIPPVPALVFTRRAASARGARGSREATSVAS